MTSHLRTEAGFSLIEAMVSLVVISVGMIGMAALYGQGLGASRQALYRTMAVNLASDMADRVRVNRLGGAAYEGAAANPGCDPSGGAAPATCTPAQMAAQDKFVWLAQLGAQLPNGNGTIEYEPGTPPTFTITVTWQEVGVLPGEHTIIVQVPEF